MKSEPPITSQPAPAMNLLAITGIFFSALGLLGWFIMLAMMLSLPYEHMSGDGPQDVFVGLGNVLKFFMRAVIGLVGLSINGTLSSVGVIVSTVGIGRAPKRPAYIGIGLGIAGLLCGAAIVIWRMVALQVIPPP